MCRFVTKWPKFGALCAKSTLAWKKYTVKGSGGSDKYELWNCEVCKSTHFIFFHFSWTLVPVWAVWRENMSLDSGVSEVTPSLKSWVRFFFFQEQAGWLPCDAATEGHSDDMSGFGEEVLAVVWVGWGGQRPRWISDEEHFALFAHFAYLHCCIFEEIVWVGLDKKKYCTAMC